MIRTGGEFPTIDFRLLFESVPGQYLVLTPDLTIVAASDAYLQATLTTRAAVVGRNLFDVFPDDANDPTATGVGNLRASLARVQQEQVADVMAVQRYPVRRSASMGGGFEERYWSPINVPVFDQGQKLAYIIHRVEDVTEFIHLRLRERESQQRTEELRLRAGAMEAEIYQRAQEIQEVNRRLWAANEALQQEITARRQAEEARLRAYAELEQLVQERTAALALANAALQHERDVLEVTLASIGDAVITTDAASAVTFLNPAAEALTGWPVRDAVGQPLTEVFRIIDEQTRHVVENPVTTVLREGRAVGLANHVVLCTNKGQEIPIDDSAAPIRDASGRLQGIVLVFRDITARRLAEVANLRLAAIVESSNDAIISKSLDGVVNSWNAAAERIFGYRAEEMIGQPIQRLLPEDRQEEEQRILERLRRGERVDHFETVRRTKDGRLLEMSIAISPLRDARGVIIGASKIARDITAQKRAEEALRQAKEAAEAAEQIKSEFVATMSHELRTPLNVILGYTDMLLDGVVGDLSSEQIDILWRIERNSRVLFELVSMVLDLNRLEAGRLPVDVKPVPATTLLSALQAELQGLCDQSGLACLWQVAPDLPLLYTDPEKLKVVLKNLVSNAVKFTQEGSISVAVEEQQGGIVFSVTDTGIGISAEAQAYIFEPFRQVDGSMTRRYGGSGLGLHIVKRLLTTLGGRITVESVVGQGSTFRVWLPLDYSPADKERA